jgi:hypothetical protein
MTTTMTTTHGDGDHWQRRSNEQDIVLAHRPDVHIFNRIEELQGERALCVMHPECKKGCRIPPRPLLLTSGFSCTSISPQLDGHEENANAIAEGKGSTAVTARCTIEHMKVHGIPFGIVENLAQLLQPANRKNLQAFHQKCEESGILARFVATDARMRGSPQRRLRTYGLLVNFEFLGIDRSEALQFANNWEWRRNSLQVLKPAIDDVVLAPDDPRVLSALGAMKGAKGAEDPKAEWGDQHIELLAKKGVPLSQQPTPVQVEQSPWSQVLCTREKKTLAKEHAEDPMVRITELLHTSARTTSTAAGSNSKEQEWYEEGESTPPVLPNSKMYDWQHDRLLIGDDMLLLQRYPVRELCSSDVQRFRYEETSQATKADLAGNAFYGGDIVASQLAFLLEVPAALLAKAMQCSAEADGDLDGLAALTADM